MKKNEDTRSENTQNTENIEEKEYEYSEDYRKPSWNDSAWKELLVIGLFFLVLVAIGGTILFVLVRFNVGGL